MARIDLAVPFGQKDEAKALGAKWDPVLKVWYAPEDVDLIPLLRWLPGSDAVELEHAPEYQVRAPYYYIIESTSDCWKCSNWTRVYAFMLPEGHEEFELVDDDEEFSLERNLGEWIRHDHRGTAGTVHSLSPSVAAQVRRYTANLKLACSKTAGHRYIMNHCEHCGAKLGDFYMHTEPGGAFFPTSPQQASNMTLIKINERFDANCGVGFATDDFFDCMRRDETRSV
ncbi:DUF5710 domain-containing protein [Pseudomonas aeruginosa]|nr:DUF5710 domain-containing protein [Pseudomonas aeruginosa]